LDYLCRCATGLRAILGRLAYRRRLWPAGGTGRRRPPWWETAVGSSDGVGVWRRRISSGRSGVRREGNRTPPARPRSSFGRFASSSPAKRMRVRRRDKKSRRRRRCPLRAFGPSLLQPKPSHGINFSPIKFLRVLTRKR
jgi:hypothetical protein